MAQVMSVVPSGTAQLLGTSTWKAFMLLVKLSTSHAGQNGRHNNGND